MKWILVALIFGQVVTVPMSTEASCAAAIKSLSAAFSIKLEGATCIEGAR